LLPPASQPAHHSPTRRFDDLDLRCARVRGSTKNEWACAFGDRRHSRAAGPKGISQPHRATAVSRRRPLSTPDEKLMPIGTLKAWSSVADRGFGFIRPRAGGADLFFHFRDLGCDPNELVIGDRLQYEIGTASDGREIATRVHWAED
jgi:cold shock CspA family protein